MASQMDDRFRRLKRAAEIIQSSLESPSASCLKEAEMFGCLSEFEILCEELRQWLDDDGYYDELAWELEEAIA